MYKIGEFSLLSRVPVKTLRYYDELGLLKPIQVDAFTGYRYYAAAQLTRLNRILALKDLGLSLQQITSLLSESLSADQIRGMLLRKQVELAEHIEEERTRLLRVEARLQQIEQESKMSAYECVIKTVPSLRVASRRGICPAYAIQDALWEVLMTELDQVGVRPQGPCFTLDHGEEYREQDVDLEVCQPIDSALPIGPLFPGSLSSVHDLPAVETMASTVHHGPFNTLSLAYPELLHWINENGYTITGPGREIYIYSGDGSVRQDDPSYVSEIQFPVAVAKKS